MTGVNPETLRDQVWNIPVAELERLSLYYARLESHIQTMLLVALFDSGWALHRARLLRWADDARQCWGIVEREMLWRGRAAA